MRAMILAAGLGTRMGDLGERLPKALLPVAGHPLIAYPLGLLKSAGITDVVVNIHHHADAMVEHLAATERLGMSVTLSHEEVLLETGGGIASASRFLADDTFVVLNADTVCDVDLTDAIQEHAEYGPVATMVLRYNPDIDAFPPVAWDPRSKRVRDVRGALGTGARTDVATMFTGIHVMEPDVFGYLTQVRESVIDGFYLPALREGRHIHGRLCDGFWADVGTPERYGAVRETFDPARLRHFQPLDLPAVPLP